MIQALRLPAPKVIPLRVSKKKAEASAEPIANPAIPKEVIAIATRNTIEMVRIEDILFLEADGNYTRIHIQSRPALFIAKTLKELNLSLEVEGFMRVHQSFLLHPSRVSQFDMVNSMLLLRSGQKIPVSRANRKIIFQKLLNWTGK